MPARLPFLFACALGAVCGLAATHAAAAEPAAPAPVRVESVDVLASPVGPVVLLKVRSKAIPIFVDAIVAQSIQGALTARKPARPLTHDLMHTVISAFEGKVSRVVVTLKDSIFHAALTVEMTGGRKVFDSRASDAIALAIHFAAPILVSEQLVESVGVDFEKPGEVRS